MEKEIPNIVRALKTVGGLVDRVKMVEMDEYAMVVVVVPPETAGQKSQMALGDYLIEGLTPWPKYLDKL